jgi:hypothetical protein
MFWYYLLDYSMRLLLLDSGGLVEGFSSFWESMTLERKSK